MIDRTWERWLEKAEREAAYEAAMEAAGDDPFAQIDASLMLAGTRATFDFGRSTHRACTFCGTTERPRDLVTIGRYINGELLTRPVCLRCKPLAEARQMVRLREGWPS